MTVLLDFFLEKKEVKPASAVTLCMYSFHRFHKSGLGGASNPERNGCEASVCVLCENNGIFSDSLILFCALCKIIWNIRLTAPLSLSSRRESLRLEFMGLLFYCCCYILRCP